MHCPLGKLFLIYISDRLVSVSNLNTFLLSDQFADVIALCYIASNASYIIRKTSEKVTSKSIHEFWSFTNANNQTNSTRQAPKSLIAYEQNLAYTKKYTSCFRYSSFVKNHKKLFVGAT